MSSLDMHSWEMSRGSGAQGDSGNLAPQALADLLRDAVREDLRQRPIWGNLNDLGITRAGAVLENINKEQFNQVARELEKSNAPLGLSRFPQAQVHFDKEGNADEIVFSAGLLDFDAKCAKFLDLGPAQLCLEKSWVKVPAPR